MFGESSANLVVDAIFLSFLWEENIRPTRDNDQVLL